MGQARTNKRIIRRETHSSRARLSVAVALLALCFFAWLAAESVLSLLGQDALLASPGQLAAQVVALPQAVLPGALAAAGVAVALLGLLVLLAAVKGGRRPRRSMDSDRVALVVDDSAIAAAVSRKVRLAANLAPEQVTTTVGKRSLRVLVRPTSGVAIDREALTSAAVSEVSSYGLTRNLRTDVRVSPEGVTGR